MKGEKRPSRGNRPTQQRDQGINRANADADWQRAKFGQEAASGYPYFDDRNRAGGKARKSRRRRSKK